MPDISNLRHTIVPKSDQLNAEQLLPGPMTLTVTDVRLGTEDQPLSIHYQDDNGRPFKPCKTMRKVLIFAWGEDGRDWPGRSMTVYNDPNVKFGGASVGGIRISHLTHIDRDISLSLTATKGKKSAHIIKPLVMANPAEQLMQAIKSSASIEALKSAFQDAYRSTKDAGQRAQFKAAYDTRTAELTPRAIGLDEWIGRIDNAADKDSAIDITAQALAALPAETDAINQAYEAAWGGA
jgi:hypothetical protein